MKTVIVYFVLLIGLNIILVKMGSPKPVWFWCDVVKVCAR
jgi:hypothetical protein